MIPNKSQLIAFNYNKKVEIVSPDLIILMNFRNTNSRQNTNQMIKLASIFSIFFVSVFYMAHILTEDKGVIDVIYTPRAQVPTSELSSTMVSDVESEDLASQSDKSLDESKITEQSGTGYYVSNYINAWKLNEANSAFQTTV